MSTYPGAIASFAGFTSSHTLAADSHASQHNSEQAEIVATQTKIGTGSSTPTSGMLLRGTGAGTSSWAQANLTSDVTGTLPVANGGTGTTLLTFPSGSDTLVARNTTDTLTNKTLITPTIASFTNANHNHQNSAGGGQLTASAITSLDLTNTTLSNPYKFSVYRNAAFTDGNGTFIVLQFDTKLFDTSSNVDVVTNKGRFTAPISGYYWFSWFVNKSNTSNTAGAGYIMKNSTTVIARGSESFQGATTGGFTVVGSGLALLSANDFVEVYTYGSGGAITTGVGTNGFMGILVSTT